MKMVGRYMQLKNNAQLYNFNNEIYNECILAHPQLRRKAACSGFRMEVPLRGTRN